MKEDAEGMSKRYGHTKIQRKIIELGEKGELTPGKIINLFGIDEERKAIEEIDKLRDMGLIKFDRTTMDEENNLCENTRLIWVPEKNEELPLDPGDVLHDPISDFIYEQGDQFYEHLNRTICQRCKKKSNTLYCISLGCQPDKGALWSKPEGYVFDIKKPLKDGETINWSAIECRMLVLCPNCLNELKIWLDIPIQDAM